MLKYTKLVKIRQNIKVKNKEHFVRAACLDGSDRKYEVDVPGNLFALVI